MNATVECIPKAGIFLFSSEVLNYTEARSFCQKRNASLAHVISEERTEGLGKLMPQNFSRFVGLSSERNERIWKNEFGNLLPLFTYLICSKIIFQIECQTFLFIKLKKYMIFYRWTLVLLRLSSMGRRTAVTFEGLCCSHKSVYQKFAALLESDALSRIATVYLRNLTVVSRNFEAASWESSHMIQLNVLNAFHEKQLYTYHENNIEKLECRNILSFLLRFFLDFTYARYQYRLTLISIQSSSN